MTLHGSDLGQDRRRRHGRGAEGVTVSGDWTHLVGRRDVMPRTITKTIHVKGKSKRIKVTVYRSLHEALDELGSIRVLKDINFMSDMRAQWALRSKARSKAA